MGHSASGATGINFKEAGRETQATAVGAFRGATSPTSIAAMVLNPTAIAPTFVGMKTVMGGIKGYAASTMPTPDTPSVATTAQARQPVSNIGGWSMTLSQQLARSAGGTLFSIPRQQTIGNDPYSMRKTLVGA